MAAQLRLYVFRGVLTAYTSGIAYAIATSIDDAKSQLIHIFALDPRTKANFVQMIYDTHNTYGIQYDMKEISEKIYEEWIADFPSSKNYFGAWKGDTNSFGKELDKCQVKVYPVQRLAFFVGGGY